MILSSHGVIASQIASFVGLLDLYPNAAAAYSVRKLRNAYAGSAIRVRRSSDNTEQDIGFSGGNLDTTTLTSFCSGTNGFVTTWYDQSGNARNATQTTASNQPQIVSSGSVISNNGKPCLQFDNSNDSLVTTYSLTRPYSIYSQFLQFSNTSVRMLNSNDSTNSLISSSRAGNTVYISGDVVSAPYASTNQNVITGLIVSTSATSKFYFNNNNIAIGSPSSNDWGTLCFGRGATFTDLANGQIKETIVWNVDQNSNNTGINTNINDYYGIY